MNACFDEEIISTAHLAASLKHIDECKNSDGKKNDQWLHVQCTITSYEEPTGEVRKLKQMKVKINSINSRKQVSC
jgi:uncharacterized membrane protein YcgQ (UPF0703/DUF1980 family)